MPIFSFPADLDDPDAHPEAVRLMFELGRVVFAAHLLERKAADELPPLRRTGWLW